MIMTMNLPNLTSLISEKQKGNVIVYDYGCLMVELHPNGWEQLLGRIDPADIYDNEKHEYGLETECHCTILYGFHLDHFDWEKMKIQMEQISPIKITLTKITAFPGADYEVLKYDVHSPYLHRLNTFFARTYPHTNEFHYTPHVTVAYLKKGKSQKYIDLFQNEPSLQFTGTKLVFSGYSSDEKLVVNVSHIGKQMKVTSKKVEKSIED